MTSFLDRLAPKHSVRVAFRRHRDWVMIGVVWRRADRSGPEPAILIGLGHVVLAVDIRPALNAAQEEALARWQAPLADRWAALHSSAGPPYPAGPDAAADRCATPG